jgi:leucyl/phenylalanyl-tRNA--protein transferase
MSDRRLTPELLLGAYAAGIFPMGEAQNDPEIYWVDPPDRGVLPLDGFHMSRSLARRISSGRYHATLDQSFDKVLEGCADRSETWINSTIKGLFLDLFDQGYAHAVAVWRGDRLVGGVYGLCLGAAFFGESMFSKETDGSKMALAWTVDHLRRTGFTLFDTQFLTPHLATLGGVEISRATYHAMLSAAIDRPTDIHALDIERDPQEVVQRMTQTS